MKYALLTLILDLLISPLVFAANSLPWEAYVRGNQVYVWKEPGWTVSDCASSIDKNFPEAVKALHAQRYEKSKAACEALAPDLLLKPKQVVSIELEEKQVLNETDKPYGPIFEDAKILHGEFEENMRYYKVRLRLRSLRGETREFVGWVEADLITTPSEKQYPQPELTTSTGKNQTNEKSSMAAEATVASNLLQIQNKTDDITVKSDAELNRFICLHRGDLDSKNQKAVLADEEDFFSVRMPESIAVAAQAESVFGVSRSLLRCTVLAESAYRKSQTSFAGAKGYAQFMPDTIDLLIKIAKDPKLPYGDMWKSYQSLNKRATLSDRAVRHSDNMPSAIGAMALYYRWMFDTELVKNLSSCSDCSGDLTKMKRKDAYLLTAGYNAGHGFIADLVRKSPASIRNAFPPPDESREYVQKIERCLGSGWETTFVETKPMIQSTNLRRKNNIRSLEQKIDFSQRVYASKLKAHNSDVAKEERRQKLLADKEAGMKVYVPPKQSIRPKPTEPDVKEQQDKIAHLKAMITIDASETYSRRINSCNERFKNEIKENK